MSKCSSSAPLSLKELTQLAETFQALHAVIRLRIIGILAQGESNVADLKAALHVSQPLLSWHLRQLRQAGFVTYRRAGRQLLYRLSPERFLELEAELKAWLGDFVDVDERPEKGA